MYTLVYENDISKENLNQNDELEEIDDKVDCESDKISKAADLINIYNISNLKEDDNLIIKQNQIEMDLIYNQSNKKFIQEHNEIFQTDVLLRKLDILFLVSQRYKYEAYYSQRMERI